MALIKINKRVIAVSDEIGKYIDGLQKKITKTKEYINKHCVNEKISKEVGYKCYTMADTNELEKIMKILGDKENRGEEDERIFDSL